MRTYSLAALAAALLALPICAQDKGTKKNPLDIAKELASGKFKDATYGADSKKGQVNDATFVVDSQPVISGPSAVTVPPGAPMTLTWTVSDPEGDAIDSFIANLSALPAANLGTFTTNALHTSGTLTWTPRLVDVGTYVVNFTAFNRLVGTASTTITVSPVAAARIFTLFEIGRASCRERV